MLQFLVDVSLPNCSYHIPKLRTTARYQGQTYFIQNGEFWADPYGAGPSYRLEAYSVIPLLAFSVYWITHEASGLYRYPYPYLYILAASGEEYAYRDCQKTNRGPECWVKYCD